MKDNYDHEPGPSLAVLIVGAGIGGLSAAIALRRRGHCVLVLDRADLSSTGMVGAAIHLCPNITGILPHWGVDMQNLGASHVSRYLARSYDGRTIQDLNLAAEHSARWSNPWLMVHRAALHKELRRVATAEEGEGVPVVLEGNLNVVGVDPQKGMVMLEGGETVLADVIVGADGIYSKTRDAVSALPLFRSGKAAFRFMIPRLAAVSDPETAPLANPDDTFSLWLANDRRVVMYPCHNNEWLNFVCVHPDTESHTTLSDEWNKETTLENVIQVFHTFEPRLLALFRKVDPATLKVWQLLDMDVLPSWTIGKLALLGDAAHPCLPYHAQGGAQAIEDAAALAAVLPRDATKLDEVSERLKLYESIRFERARRIQHYSRLAGQDRGGKKKAEKFDALQFKEYNFNHNEMGHAAAAYAEWLKERQEKCGTSS
ncbi:uncharacterized protein C8A04DRAFT_24180 [Dichotomopilus funicola]|uniref:FAD-binding domain-containing protein n=1 Tax=Dichotomopilus funicola TaxID=1934379 RepID=A0AAN6VA33_9PEZI|nr:hypothetical protein C8A04DRAFT_24180 [Dichotomopilus funicola]